MREVKKGSMLMEFVLVMPILFMLIMLIIQFAQIMVARQFVAYAAFCSTRSMLCSNPSEWHPLLNPDKRDRCTHQAARRVLAWVNIFGDPATADRRSWDEDYLYVSAGKFSDVADEPISFVTTFYGSKDTQDVLVPGWGQIPESNSVDKRLEVTPGISQGRCAWSTVKYDFPLLIPVAGQMISFLAQHSAEESQYMKSKALMPGWTGEQELFDEDPDEVPYITLTETCVLPLPYSTARLPVKAFDYDSYD